MSHEENGKAFSLYAGESGAFKDAVVLGQGLPQSIGGQPVSYFWKEVIRAGQYTHPQTGALLTVTPGRMDRWVANFRRMRQHGVKVYVPVNHSRKTEDNRGYVVDARRRGNRLELLHQLIGQDAVRDAARSEVSLRIVPDFKDGLGNVYDEAIEHSSLVVDPVVPGQGQFEPAPELLAASRGYVLSAAAEPGEASKKKGTVMNATQEQLAVIEEIKGLLGEPGAAATPEGALESAIALARELHGRWSASRQAEQVARTELEMARASLEQKERQIAEFSRKEPDAPDAGTLSLLARSLRSEREAAVASGGLSPATARELEELLCDGGKPSGLALSRCGQGGEPLAFRLWAILRRNKPVELGQRSGVQTLGRVMPPDELATEAGKLPYEEMAARYNQRGR